MKNENIIFFLNFLKSPPYYGTELINIRSFLSAYDMNILLSDYFERLCVLKDLPIKERWITFLQHKLSILCVCNGLTPYITYMFVAFVIIDSCQDK